MAFLLSAIAKKVGQGTLDHIKEKAEKKLAASPVVKTVMPDYAEKYSLKSRSKRGSKNTGSKY